MVRQGHCGLQASATLVTAAASGQPAAQFLPTTPGMLPPAGQIIYIAILYYKGEPLLFLV